MLNSEKKDEDLFVSGNAAKPIVSRSQFKPILFSMEMVAAILNKTKTQTRRIIPEKIVDAYYDYDDWASSVGKPEGISCTRTYEKEYFMDRCRWSIGDILWVRETWRIVHINHTLKTGDFFTIQFKDYWALEFKQVKNFQEELRDKFYEKSYEISGIGDAYGKWRPSLFMPKYACRLFLEVKDTQTERLTDISDGSVAMEGVSWNEPLEFGRDKRNCNSPAQRAFRRLWDKINGVESWEDNPHVWVLTFKIAECPKSFC